MRAWHVLTLRCLGHIQEAMLRRELWAYQHGRSAIWAGKIRVDMRAARSYPRMNECQQEKEAQRPWLIQLSFRLRRKEPRSSKNGVRTARCSPGSWAKEVLEEGGWPAAPYPSFNLQGCHSRLYTKDSPLISFLFSAGGELKSIAFVFFFSLQTLTTFDNKECLLLWKPSDPTHMKEEIKT